MTKINKSQAASIAGMSQKWIENKINGDRARSVAPDTDWLTSVGFERLNNGRVSFDEQKFRMFYAKSEISAPTQIENPANRETNLETFSEKSAAVRNENSAIGEREQTSAVKTPRKPRTPRNTDFQKEFTDALVLPHKLIKTLREAHRISGVPQAFLKQFGIFTPAGYKFTNEIINSAATKYLEQYQGVKTR